MTRLNCNALSIGVPRPEYFPFSRETIMMELCKVQSCKLALTEACGVMRTGN